MSVTITRDDIQGAIVAPSEIQQFLTRKGGKNPYGEPIYRLVYASARVQQEAGLFCKWREGSDLRDRGGMIAHPDYGMTPGADAAPMSVEFCMKPVAKYPGVEGWLLERWYPASFYGGEESWYRHKTPNNLPLLGPYPVHGDYERMSDAATYMPSLSELTTAIEAWEQLRDETMAENQHTRYLKRMAQLEAEMEKADTDYTDYVQKFLKDFCSPLWGSSLAAGRLRQEYATRAGVKEHAGA